MTTDNKTTPTDPTTELPTLIEAISWVLFNDERLVIATGEGRRVGIVPQEELEILEEVDKQMELDFGDGEEVSDSDE